MWHTFQHDGNFYMIKILQFGNFRLVLTDFQKIWMQDISRHELLQQFQETNSVFDLKVDEVVSEFIEVVNKISDLSNIAILEADEKLELFLNSMKSGYKIGFHFTLHKSSPLTFLEEVTIPLIRTVKHLEDRQNVLINLLQKKDRELEEYKLEKGLISRNDLDTEKFDEKKLSSIDDNSMMNVFGQNETFWNSFLSQRGNKKEANNDEVILAESDCEMEQCPRAEPPEPVEDMLPEKSKGRYERSYQAYKDWCSAQGIHDSSSVNVVLAYFSDLAKYKKPSTLWAIYSMLRITLNIKENIDISKFSEVRAFLKKQSLGYKPQKSSTFSKTEIETFLKGAPFEFLPHKVALILGVSGACRSEELSKISVDDLHFLDKNKVCVSIQDKKTFMILNPEWIAILKEYLNLRKNIDTNRLFTQVRYNKMTKQPIGHNSITMFAKKIATYLKLKHPKNFTGHCFRRTATMLADHDGNNLKTSRGSTSAEEETEVENITFEPDPLGDHLDFEVVVKEEPFP